MDKFLNKVLLIVPLLIALSLWYMFSFKICLLFYGLFSLRFEKNPYETVGDMMTLEELDTILCALVNFMEFKLS